MYKHVKINYFNDIKLHYYSVMQKSGDPSSAPGTIVK